MLKDILELLDHHSQGEQIAASPHGTGSSFQNSLNRYVSPKSRPRTMPFNSRNVKKLAYSVCSRLISKTVNVSHVILESTENWRQKNAPPRSCSLMFLFRMSSRDESEEGTPRSSLMLIRTLKESQRE